MALTVAYYLVFVLFAMCRSRVLRSVAGPTLAVEVSEYDEKGWCRR